MQFLWCGKQNLLGHGCNHDTAGLECSRCQSSAESSSGELLSPQVKTLQLFRNICSVIKKWKSLDKWEKSVLSWL